VQNKFYILEREQGTGNREQIRNTEIFLFSKNVKLILLRYLIVGGDFGDDFVTNQDIRLLSEVEVQD
jgi:hypothetical protein